MHTKNNITMGYHAIQETADNLWDEFANYSDGWETTMSYKDFISAINKLLEKDIKDCVKEYKLPRIAQKPYKRELTKEESTMLRKKLPNFSHHRHLDFNGHVMLNGGERTNGKYLARYYVTEDDIIKHTPQKKE